MRKLTYNNPIGGSIELYFKPFLLTSVEGLDLPQPNNQEDKAPFQDGTTPIDQLFKPREIVVSGSILAPQDFSGIATYRRQLLSALNPKAGPGTLTYQNNLRSYLMQQVVAEGSLFKNKQLDYPYQDFQITFYCHDPYLYDTTPTSVGIGASTLVQNLGDVEAPVTITIPGPCTNPTITNVTTGLSIAYVGSVPSGTSLVISTVFGNKSALLGGVNAMPNISPSSTFWSLLLGNNYIEATFGSGTPSVTLAFYNKYLGA